jgi:signal transduction histidine kinase
MVGLSVLAATLAIVLFGVPLAAIVVRYCIDDERNELERVADLAAVSASVQLVQGRPPGELPRSRDVTALGVFTPDGRRIAGSGPDVADPVTVRARTIRIERSTDAHGDIVVAVPIATDTALLGVVRASTPRTETYAKIGIAWLFMAGLAIVALGAVWLVARMMGARMSRPLEQLAGTARALGDGDFSARVRPAGIPEIDTVVAALNSTAARISDVVARERAFSADASHQLRTPLTALRLGLEIALDEPEQDLRAAVTEAITGTDRLQRTIEDLLALARDSARPAQPLALAALLDELTATWGPRLAEASRTLRVLVRPAIPVSGASPAAVRQILAVLVDNAVTHGRGAVRLTVRDAGHAVAVDVADEGVELTVPSAQLFARRAPSATGHGIGLALARRLAEAEGGRLRLSASSPPTFTLLVPALGDDQPEDMTAMQRPVITR